MRTNDSVDDSLDSVFQLVLRHARPHGDASGAPLRHGDALVDEQEAKEGQPRHGHVVKRHLAAAIEHPLARERPEARIRARRLEGADRTRLGLWPPGM